MLPVATLLFTGADLLADAGIPTFGWNINAEWGSEHSGPGQPLRREGVLPLLHLRGAQEPAVAGPEDGCHKVGVLAYSVPQSADCAKGVQASFDKYPDGRGRFLDTSLAFGVTDLSARSAT